MYYYDPDTRTPRRWAMVLTLLYAVALAAAFLWVEVDLDALVEQPETLYIDLSEPAPEPEPAPLPEPEPTPAVQPAPAEIDHDAAGNERPAQEVTTAKPTGQDAQTTTPNPRALFSMAKGGTDEPEPAGNPYAKEDPDAASGDTSGLHPSGFDQLDKGLQGRGLVGDLPRPRYPGKEHGVVIIRVTVGANGHVTSATYEPTGSTTSDAALVDAALEAARKARFTESSATLQGGTIAYRFRMQ